MGKIETYEEKCALIRRLNLTSDVFAGKVLQDGAESEAVRNLQRYFVETVPENESRHFPKLVSRMRALKYTTKGVGEMCEVFDQVKEYGREEGRGEGILLAWRESLCNLLQKFGEIPVSVMDGIVNQNDVEELRRWFQVAMRAESMEFFERTVMSGSVAAY